jgi:3-methylcrotonyl-CoA carboxylase alpha subunit
MFRKILIANRGEIACRVIATARRLGVATVAVYSDADAHARHVDLADEAWPIGAARAQESYLAIDKIVAAARQSGAEAIHPGYGFLSENPAFATACAKAGICFIGPPPEAMRVMGSKAAAKTMMERAGVPILPGYHGDAQDLTLLAGVAADIGFPVLIKASAAGGGKGMRIVERCEDLPEALEGARREALASFGDDRLLIEKYVPEARHIEVQIFADQHGEIVSFFERDCSIQRRHQKIVEETPAPGIDPLRRRAMAEAAITAARAVGYVGAGTVEFLVKGDRFYFLEMNARLQVEHPVTEMISRQDLVEWQLRVASGEKLPLTQQRLSMLGHSIEARIYAEDPGRGFLPSTGRIRHLRQPREAEAVRVDTGLRQGDPITQDYDPLIAKLIVWGVDRAAALQRLESALAEYEIVGVATNLDVLRAIATHPAFMSGESDTGFIERHIDQLLAPASPAGSEETTILAAGAAARLGDLRAKAAAEAANSGDPWSPWDVSDAWRIDGQGCQTVIFDREGESITLRVHALPDGSIRVETPATAMLVSAEETGDGMRLRIDGVLRQLRVVREDFGLVVVLAGRNHFLRYVDPLAPPRVEASGALQLTAPLPARVTRVLVGTGDFVKKGAPVIVLEAMKMEITLTAPDDGVIADIRYAEGDVAPEGAELVVLAAGEAP